MSWFGRNAQREDALLDIIREDRERMAGREAQVLELMTKLVETVGQTQAAHGEYLKIFTQAPKPEVRVMDDAAELLAESKRRRPEAPFLEEFNASVLPDMD